MFVHPGDASTVKIAGNPALVAQWEVIDQLNLCVVYKLIYVDGSGFCALSGIFRITEQEFFHRTVCHPVRSERDIKTAVQIVAI